MFRVPPLVNTGLWDEEFNAVQWVGMHQIGDWESIKLLKMYRSRDFKLRIDKINWLLACLNRFCIEVEKDELYYIAGPYTGGEENKVAADLANRVLWSRGVPCVCPHMNTRDYEKHTNDQVFVRGYKKCLWRFSGLILLDGWEGSKGSVGEVVEALRVGVPIYKYSNLADERNIRWKLEFMDENGVTERSTLQALKGSIA